MRSKEIRDVVNGELNGISVEGHGNLQEEMSLQELLSIGFFSEGFCTLRKHCRGWDALTDIVEIVPLHVIPSGAIQVSQVFLILVSSSVRAVWIKDRPNEIWLIRVEARLNSGWRLPLPFLSRDNTSEELNPSKI